MSRKEVKADRYDEAWIASAWGEQETDFLLRSGQLRPRPRVARAMELLTIKPGMRVLDIACGRGEVPALVAEAGGYVIGLDYSPAVLEIARKVRDGRRIGLAPDAGIELIQGDATRLPFSDASFDRITMLDIIEHLLPHQLEAMFREVRRLLTPDGYAVIHTLPNRWVYDIGYRLGRLFLPRLPVDPRGEIEKQIHVNEQDLPRLHQMLAHSGLRHRLWLEQLMPAQARWKKQEDVYGDNRDKVYPLLAGPAGRVVELISSTPVKLLLSNDIFGIAWSRGWLPVAARPPLALTERLIYRLSTKSKPYENRPPS